MNSMSASQSWSLYLADGDPVYINDKWWKYHHDNNNHQSAKRPEPTCLRSLVPSEETRELDPSFSKRGVHLFLNSFSFSLSKRSTIFMFSVGFGGSCFQKDILNLVYIRFYNSSSTTHMKSFGLFVSSFSVTLKFSLVCHPICFNFAVDTPIIQFFISNF